MNYFSKTNFSRWLWLLSMMYCNCIVIFGLMTLTNGLAIKNNENFIDNLGWVYPEHDIVLRRGQSLTAFCSINPKYVEVYGAHLTFKNDLGTPCKTIRVNATTIRVDPNYEWYYDLRPKYKCYLISNMTKSPTSSEPKIPSNSSASMNKYSESVVSDDSLPSVILIGSVRVKIDYSQVEIYNFSCISYNWNYLTCTWVIPESCDKLKPQIQYLPLNSKLAIASSCPLDYYLPKANLICAGECTWSSNTDPPYLHDFEDLKITLSSNNVVEKSFYFNKFKHVKPDPPLRLLILSDSFNIRCRLTWQLNDLRGLRMIPTNWTFQIKFNSDQDSGDIVCDSKAITRVSNRISFEYDVNGLRPRTKYKFNIRMKSTPAPMEEKYWSDYSDPAYWETRALSDSVFPKTDSSLFEIIESNKSSRSVNIFWEPLIDTDLYDSYLSYKIHLYNINQIDDKQLVESRDYFVDSEYFTDTYNISSLAHQFVITSEFSEGNASNASFINVPAAHDQVKPCTLFYVISRDHYNKTITFECIWKPPKEQNNILNYTLFWYGPQSIFNWTHVSANMSEHQISINNNQWVEFPQQLPQFYISANTKHSSSGLLQMPMVHSVSHVWHTPWFVHQKYKLMKNQTKKYLPKVDSKRIAYSGLKISPNQFQKWMNRLHGTKY